MAERLDAIVGGGTDVLRGQITKNDDGTISSPDNIIKNVHGARAVFHKYRTEHLNRITLYAAIEGLIAGNPPYNPNELKKHGLSHIANFNTLEGRALWERGCLAYWNLLNEAETIVKFTIRDENPQARALEDIMSIEWDKVVRKWRSFETLMGTMSGQLVKFGISPILWPDERDWRWRTIELSKFFIADQAQSDIEQITAVCVESQFTAQYLFEVYEQLKDLPPDKSPWNCDELSHLLLYIANTFAKTDYQYIDFFDLQKRLQNGDIGYDALFSDAIRIISLFYKEYDGKFSHYMFHRVFDHGDFLYFVDRQYESLDEVLSIFTASPGEYTIHSNRGLGHKIFSIAQAMMQLDCSIVDAARWASTPLIKGPSASGRDFEAIRFTPGVMTNIGMAEIQQNNIGSNINQLVGASQYLSQKVQYNLANSGDDPGVPDRNVGSISPTEARMKSYREFSVLKNNIAHFYRQFDAVVQNMTIKMLESKPGYPGYEYAKEWKDRCMEQGVPEDVFKLAKKNPWGMPRHLEVKASRVAGDGSTLARIMGLQELMVIAGDFSPSESREYKRQWIMATQGKEYISAFMGPDESSEGEEGSTIAGLENNSMQNGQSPVISPKNDHRAHFGTHMALASNIIQALQQQQTDPVEADKIFAVLVPHMQEHFHIASKSPFNRTFIEENKKNLGQIVQYATLNRKNALAMKEAELRKAQEAQTNQQRVMSEEELKNMQVMNEERRKDIKVQSQVERAREANETRAQVMKDKIVRDADNQRLKIQLDSSNKRIENQQKSVENLRKEIADMTMQGGPAPADLPSFE